MGISALDYANSASSSVNIIVDRPVSYPEFWKSKTIFPENARKRKYPNLTQNSRTASSVFSSYVNNWLSWKQSSVPLIKKNKLVVFFASILDANPFSLITFKVLHCYRSMSSISLSLLPQVVCLLPTHIVNKPDLGDDKKSVNSEEGLLFYCFYES